MLQSYQILELLDGLYGITTNKKLYALKVYTKYSLFLGQSIKIRCTLVQLPTRIEKVTVSGYERITL